MSRPRAPRRPAALLRAVLVAGAVAAVTAGPTVAVAAAEEPGGTLVVGRLLQAWPESGPDEPHAGHEAAAPLSWVETADGAVRVPTEDLLGVPAGATVELTVGAPVRDEASVEHGLGPAQAVLSTGSVTPAEVAAPARGPVTNQVTVVLVAPAGTQPDAAVTPADVAAPVAGAVADFWSEQTDGAVRFGVAGTHGWLRTAAGCAEPTALWDEAAAAVGFEPGPGRHLMLYLSSQTAGRPGCSYALAEVGTGPSSGGRLYVTDRLPSVMAHELGHNMGLTHSSGLQCEGTVETGACRTVGYRDHYDVMGASWRQLGSLSAPQAAQLGVLPAGSAVQLDVRDAATSVVLAPMGARTGTRAVRLLDAEGTAYWLEYRTALGRDAWLGRPAENRYRLQTGVLLRRAAQFPDTAVLLDGTPGTAAGWDDDWQAALPVGEPIALSGADFTVTVRSLGDAGAVLDVVPTAPATPGAPTAPRDSGAGRLLAGSAASGAQPGSPARRGAAAAPAAGVAPGEAPVALPAGAAPAAAVTADASLEPTSGSTPTGGLFVALGAAGLAGASVVVLRRVRRLRVG